MDLRIEVKRERISVTQGYADVYVNGIKVISFEDKIRPIEYGGKRYYGVVIGDWASIVPDEEFIKGLLFHPFDDVYHYSDAVRSILDKAINEAKRQDDVSIRRDRNITFRRI